MSKSLLNSAILEYPDTNLSMLRELCSIKNTFCSQTALRLIVGYKEIISRTPEISGRFLQELTRDSDQIFKAASRVLAGEYGVYLDDDTLEEEAIKFNICLLGFLNKSCGLIHKLQMIKKAKEIKSQDITSVRKRRHLRVVPQIR